jgi:glycosyltransferase involved in cell wall biosynthesis
VSRALVISYSDLARDPRVDRQISFLASEHDVVAAGLAPPEGGVEFIDLSPQRRHGVGEVARQARSLRGIAESLTLRTLGQHERAYWRYPLNRLAVRRLAGVAADVVIANDLSALPLAIRVAGDAPVIFDAHELSTEEHSQIGWWRMLVAPHADALLRRGLPRVAAMMTVSSGIAMAYAERYGARPLVVTNAPPERALEPSPVAEPIRLIHHGIAVAERRLELMIEAMDLVDERFTLDLMLVPSQARYLARLRRLAATRPRVRLLDPIPQRSIVEWCNAYDVGVFVLPPRNRNQLHVLPNKLFEFIQARLAVVIGPSPEMARIVREHGCGLVARDFTAQGLAEALATQTPADIAAYKQRSNVAARSLNAEQNRAALLSLVEHVLGRSRAPELSTIP